MAAESDLLQIWSYVALEQEHADPAAADTILNEINEAFHLLAEFPYHGSRCDEQGPTVSNVRRLNVRGYQIYYCITESFVSVSRIIHERRNRELLHLSWATQS